MRKASLSILLLFSILHLASQNAVDSLQKLLLTAKTDTDKVKIYFALTDESYGTTEELKYADTSLSLAQKTKNIRFIEKAYNAMGNALFTMGDNRQALRNYFNVLDLALADSDKVTMSKCYNNIGNCYDVMAVYDKALDYYFKSLRLKEELGQTNKLFISRLNIAVVYYNLKEYKKSIEYCEMALPDCIKYKSRLREANIYHNLGNNYADLKDYTKAIHYFEKAAVIANEEGDKAQYTISLNGLSHCYFSLDQNDKTLETSSRCLDTCIKYDLKVQYCEAKNQLAEVYLKLGKYDLAEQYATSVISVAKENQITKDLNDAYLSLSNVYAKLGKHEKALEYYKLYTDIKDSVINDNKSQMLANLQENYEIEKRESQNKLLQTENELSAKTIRQQKIITYFIIIGLLIVSVLAFFIFRGLNKQRQANRIIRAQKKEVEEKHKEITDSINYAERIQRSFLATKELLDENLKEYFVFFKPKDVVSGDFYWAAKLHNDQFALVTADSTGHGVPGAIMSLLNIMSLEKGIESYVKASDILNSARKTIIQRLKKDGSLEGGKDGMDASLCIFDFANKKLTVAAANNPVWIMRANAEGHTEVIEVKPDKMPVGKHDKDMVPFSQHEFYLEKGDVVYSLTDGFPDQFGGPSGKKFMIKNLRELLRTNAHLPMHEQKNLLEQTFLNWVGDLEQVDDVCIIGIRV